MVAAFCEGGASPSATAGCEARPESESPRTGTTSARTIGRRAIGNSFQVRFRCGDSGHSGVLVCSFRCFPGAPGCACRLTSSASPPSTRSSQDPCPALAGRAKALLLHGFFPVRGLGRETRLVRLLCQLFSSDAAQIAAASSLALAARIRRHLTTSPDGCRDRENPCGGESPRK